MLRGFLLLSLFCGLFAMPEKTATSTEEDLKKLKELTGAGEARVREILEKIANAKTVNEEIVEERTKAFVDVYHLLTNEVAIALRNTVFKGVDGKKLAGKYQCVTSAHDDVANKLNSTYAKVAKSTVELKEKALKKVQPYKPVLLDLLDYLLDLQHVKEEEVKKAETVEGVIAILADASEKVKTLHDVANQINAGVDDAKFKFFEEYVDLVHNSENSLKKSGTSGKKKMSQCLN